MILVNNEEAIIKLFSVLKAGDEVLVQPGHYSFTDTLVIKAMGEYESKCVIHAQNCVFDFIQAPYKANGVETSGSYLQLDGLKIQNAGYKGLLINTVNSTYINLEIAFSMDSGIQLVNGSNIIQNCDSHDNFDYRLCRGFYCPGFSSDGFSDKLHSNAPNTFIGCRSWNNGDDGFDFFSRYTTDYTKLIDCWSFSNGITNIDMTKHPKYELDKEWFAKFENGYTIYSANKSKTFNNTCYPGFGNGNGFKLSGNCIAHNVELNNCIALNNRMKGFDQNSNFGEMHLSNCIAARNKRWDYGFWRKNGILVLDNCVAEGENCFNIADKTGNVKTRKVDITIANLLAPRKEDGSLPDLNVNDNE